MDSYSVSEAARLLGMSPPTVYTLLRTLRIRDSRESGSTVRITSGELNRLAKVKGAVPILAPGTSRQEMLILAALNKRLYGLSSARAVARVTGLSPTSASKSLKRLATRGLVRRVSTRVTAGSSRTLMVWMVNIDHPDWWSGIDAVRQVTLPLHGVRTHPKRVPSRFAHLFWNGDARDLDLDRDGVFVAARLLFADEPRALAWAALHLKAEAIRRAASIRGVSPRDRALALNIASQRERLA